jgi:hypothetical protein
VARCEACGNDCPDGATYCGACGHRLGVAPEEPLTINVRVVDPQPAGCLSGCWSCFTIALALLVIFVLVAWLFSC